MPARNWRQDWKVVDTLVASGAKKMTATLDAAAVADATGGKVTITSTAHGFLSPSNLYITGTTNYSGNRTVTAVATDTITCYGAYVAETPAGSETISVILAPGVSFEIFEIRMHVSAAPTTSEYFTITLDNNSGAYWDTVLYKHDFAATSTTDLVWSPDRDHTFDPGDKIVFAWDNTDTKTWGLEAKFRRIHHLGIGG